MNDDRLSPREHAEVRDALIAGAQRIRPAGAHRMQIIAGVVAFVLIAGISGGAVTTAALLGSKQTAPVATSPTPPIPTPMVTPTPTPTPTATPAPPPPEGVVAFDGSCENVLSTEEVSQALGVAMEEFGPQWSTGAAERLGGIECTWRNATPSPYPSLVVSVYPAAVVPADELVEHEAQCAWEEGWAESAAPCNARSIVGDVWISMSAYPGLEDAATLDRLAESVAGRLSDFPSPRPEASTDAWWTLPACGVIDASVDIAAPFTASSQLLLPTKTSGIAGRVGAIERCEWSLDEGRVNVALRVIPGGAAAFDTIASSENAVLVEVDGAVAATTAMDDDPWEKYFPVLAVSDGVNLLILQPLPRMEIESSLRIADLGPLAAQILRLLNS